MYIIDHSNNQIKISFQSEVGKENVEEVNEQIQSSNFDEVDSKLISPYALFQQSAEKAVIHGVVAKVHYLDVSYKEAKVYFDLDKGSKWQMAGFAGYIFLQGTAKGKKVQLISMEDGEIFTNGDKTYDYWLIVKDFKGVEHKKAVRKVTASDLQ